MSGTEIEGQANLDRGLIEEFAAYQDFKQAGEAILDCLHEVLGFDLWMITRTVGNDWIVLLAEDHGYGVQGGDVFTWTDTFCSRMVNNQGPMVAPVAMDVESYAEAPIAQQLDIGAYVGVPLTDGHGGFFGTLCGIDPKPQPLDIEDALPYVRLSARLLATMLSAERDEARIVARAERAEREAETDPLTGVGNRRAWDRALAIEEARSARYGDPASVIILDVDGLKQVNDELGHAAGDELLKRTASVLDVSTRDSDIVARLGGDEFGVLAVETGLSEADALVERIVNAFVDNSIQASIGVATRRPDGGLVRAWKLADKEMYAAKESE